MTRQEAMNRLRSLIPSFERDYIPFGEPADKSEDMEWLYRDDYIWDKDNHRITLPELIPADYMVGIEVNIDRGEYVSIPRSNTEKGRKVALSVMDFGMLGNTHKYGTLSIPGVQWKSKTDGHYILSSQIDKMVPQAKTHYEVKLYKIIAPDDLSQKVDDWDGYDPGCATQRFENLAELYCTAAYVSLLRVGGPYYLYVGESYVIPDETDYLLVVDENDNVEFCRELNWAIKEMENNG